MPPFQGSLVKGHACFPRLASWATGMPRLRRFSLICVTSVTNAFSKKWENLKAALALYFAYYNFCRIHSSIRYTPAMEAGITKHVWELKELLS